MMHGRKLLKSLFLSTGDNGKIMVTYTLPDGNTTKNTDEYVSIWRDYGRKLTSVFGGELAAFDPGFVLNVGGKRIEIGLDICKKIIELIDERDELKKKLETLTQ